MAIDNGGFETAGSAPGEAGGWSTGETSSAREYAGFGALSFDFVHVLSSVAVPNGQNFAQLSASALEAPVDPVAGVTSATSEGAVCAAVTVGSWSGNLVAGIEPERPQSLCRIRRADDCQRIYSNGQEVLGLLQVQSGTVDGDNFDDSTHRGQISFVRYDGAGGLEAVPVADIEDETIRYCYTKRRQLDAETAREAFEEGWRGTDFFLFELGPVGVANFGGDDAYDSFEWYVYLGELPSVGIAEYDANSYTQTVPSRTCDNAETYDLFDGATLTVKVDGGSEQTIIFDDVDFADIANATSSEVAASIDAAISGASADSVGSRVRVTSDDLEGGSVEVTGGTANSGGVNRLGFQTVPITGTEPWPVTIGEQLQFTSDQGGPALTDALVGTVAMLYAADHAPAVPIPFDPAGEYFDVHVNKRHVVRVRVDNGDIDLSDVSDRVDEALTAAGIYSTEAYSFLFGGPVQLGIASRWKGYDSEIKVTGVTAGTLQKIGYSNEQIGVPASGTGNIALEGAAKADDFVALINASGVVGPTGIGAVNLHGKVRVQSPPEGFVKVHAGVLARELGFDPVDVNSGPSALARYPLEDFEEGWGSNEDFKTEFEGVGVDLEAATFDGEPKEDFEDAWNNSDFDWEFAPADLSAAQYRGTNEFEDFGSAVPPRSCTADPSTDLFTTTDPHGIASGSKVTMENKNGALPSPLNLRHEYFVGTSTSYTFNLRRQVGGTTIDLTDSGTGTHYVRRDPETYWTTFMETI